MKPSFRRAARSFSRWLESDAAMNALILVLTVAGSIAFLLAVSLILLMLS